MAAEPEINEAGNVAAIAIKEENKVAHHPTLLSLITCVMTLLLAWGALTLGLQFIALVLDVNALGEISFPRTRNF